MAIKQTFFGLDVATLTTLRHAYLECFTAIATAGQSYSISNRNFTRADLAEVKDTIAELQAAIDYAQGKYITRTLANFRR
jgi:hypothetical protein